MELYLTHERLSNSTLETGGLFGIPPAKLKSGSSSEGFNFGFLMTLQMGDACTSTYTKVLGSGRPALDIILRNITHIRDMVSYWPGVHHLSKTLWPASMGAPCLCLPALRLRVCTIPSVFTQLLGPNSSVCNAMIS